MPDKNQTMKNTTSHSFVTSFNLFLFLSFLLSGMIVKAQVAAPSQNATVTILVTDMDQKPRENEKIIFESIEGGEMYEGVSDKNGEFEINLPGGSAYNIKIKNVGEAEDYNKLSIPALKEGEMYGPMKLTISFEPAREFTLDNVHFFSGKYTLTKASYPELNELVEFMKLKKEIKIEIAGHTDNVGENAANIELSRARADVVRQYLISKGIAGTRIVANGYGEKFPIDSNETENGRSVNRRTEVRIVGE
jgi:outer membrane protein OmpA-like peptidoglycan-associated protein